MTALALPFPASGFVRLALRRWRRPPAPPPLPDDMEDWQLRDLNLTRPNKAFRPEPCRPLFHWLP